MNDPPEFTEKRQDQMGPSQGFKQVVAVIVLAGAIVILAAVFVIQRELTLQRAAMKWTVSEFGLDSPITNRLLSEFTDADEDLVADPPDDEDEWITPTTLVFSFIPGSESGKDAELWRPITDAIAKATNIEVELRPGDNVDHQIKDLRTRTLHITALNTGAVPRAVNVCGFVPICTWGDERGQSGVTMRMLVPENSKLNHVADLKKNRIMFTSESSNSGFKAPIVILNEDFGMQPGIDYDYGFSTSHDASIEMIRTKAVKAAPVASDLLQLAIAEGRITKADYHVIYESERFPPAAFGYLYCLHPDIAEKIRAAMVDLDFASTPLNDALRAEKFVGVNYKNDWALIRRIDNALGVVHKMPEPPAPAEEPDSSDDVLADSDESAGRDLSSAQPEQTKTVAEPQPDDSEPADADAAGDESGTERETKTARSK